MSASRDPQDRNLWLRGQTYYCRIEVNGRSERVSLRTGDIAKARAERDQLLKRAEGIRSGQAPEHVPTWEDAVVAYAAAVLDRAGALSPRTAERYRDSLRVVDRYLTGKPVAEIDNKAIGRLVAGRQAAGVKNATIRRDLTAVSRVLALATAQGHRDGGNPAKSYDRSFLSEARDVIRPPTDAEVERAAKLLEDAPAQWPVLVRWLRATGMRLGEALGAKRGDIATVTEGKRRVTRLTLYQVKGKRRGRMRTITLSPAAEALLPALSAGERLFGEFDPTRGGNLSTQWLKFRESREGMPVFRLHDLRHAYAVAALQADPTSLYRLSRHLGHTSVATTERYYLRFLSDEQQHTARFGAAEVYPVTEAVTGQKRRKEEKPDALRWAGH